MPLRSRDALGKVKLAFLHSVAQLETPLSQVKGDLHQQEAARETSGIPLVWTHINLTTPRQPRYRLCCPQRGETGRHCSDQLNYRVGRQRKKPCCTCCTLRNHVILPLWSSLRHGSKPENYTVTAGKPEALKSNFPTIQNYKTEYAKYFRYMILCQQSKISYHFSIYYFSLFQNYFEVFIFFVQYFSQIFDIIT